MKKSVLRSRIFFYAAPALAPGKIFDGAQAPTLPYKVLSRTNYKLHITPKQLKIAKIQ
jgi:hypothetical protein